MTRSSAFTMRPATMDGVDIVTELANACTQELVGRAEWEAQNLRCDWGSPQFVLASDSRLVFAADGRLVGFASAWIPKPHTMIVGRTHVHPGYRGQGIGTLLADWLESRGELVVAGAPEGARVHLEQELINTDHYSVDLLQGRGYQVMRQGCRMVADLDGEPVTPTFPEGISVRGFDRARDLLDLVRAEREAFRDSWGHVERPLDVIVAEWNHYIDNDAIYDPALCFLAMDGAEIAGYALCSLKTPQDPEMGWVEGLGVRRPWRRQGLGLALLQHSFAELYRRGRHRVGLWVDAQSLTGAERLYERAGMHPDRTYLHMEKELQPGKELRTETLEGSDGDIKG